MLAAFWAEADALNLADGSQAWVFWFMCCGLPALIDAAWAVIVSVENAMNHTKILQMVCP